MNLKTAEFISSATFDLISFSNGKNEEIAKHAKKILYYIKELQEGKITEDEAADLIKDLKIIESSQSYANELAAIQKINEISQKLFAILKAI
jgi:division protein CdvB (Snf7/Vps24/ESCRT-III family)